MFNLFILNDSFFSSFNYNLLNIMPLLCLFCSVTLIISKNPIVFVLFFISLLFNIAGYLLVLGLNFLSLTYLLLLLLGGLILLPQPVFIHKLLIPKMSLQHMYQLKSNNNSCRLHLKYVTLSENRVAIFDNNSIYPTALNFFFPQTRLVLLPLFGELRGCIIVPLQRFEFNRRLVPYSYQFYPSSLFFPCYTIDVSFIRCLYLQPHVHFMTGEFVMYISPEKIQENKFTLLITKSTV